MGEVISFSEAGKRKLLKVCEEFARQQTESLDEAQLRELMETAGEKLRQLDEIEPADMLSEAYGEWADVHEQVEDLYDELLDELDELT